MEFNTNLQLKKALEFAQISLAGKKRKSGEEVLEHCKRVAEILVKFKVNDPSTLAAALLHHSLSEGAANLEDIQKEFGEDISSMINTFEKLRIIRARPGIAEEFAENLRKMFLVLAKDLRIVLIKLADILDNLTTLEYLSKDKKLQVAQETLDIFAPLADRLGMSELKGQMQDLAFKHLDPNEYEWVKKYTSETISRLEKDHFKVKNKILVILEKEGIVPQIQSRVKHAYSLYQKLLRPEINKDLARVYDLLAMRILTLNEEECYQVLGIISKNFRLIEDKITDYIAHPKPNGYKSIHIKVMGPSNIPFEIQIRTKAMHEQAEYGLAAHWNYAEKKESGLSDEKISQGFATSAEKLDWVKRLSEWQHEITDNSEFLKLIKTDMFGEKIYVFTPKGDVKELPKDSTPIDFAYKVHTDLGNRVKGAKVNGAMVPLNYKLKDGEVVEIIEAKDKLKKPNRDWIQFVVTSEAKKRIKRANI